MRHVLLAIIIVTSLTPIAVAEPLRLDRAEKATTEAKPLPTKRAYNSCATFGAGFVKVDGTDTCVKIGGAVSVGVGGAAGSR
jgi:Porin subfamily